ncbi:hypothetical protein VTN77DRAFT_4372 [Rasamsonia byssochlamydoides]|uniref:uncharacterized protein n=1 Tax=Rasamsonia byssochlamydoides TaxID=89139 RepID=UPI003742807E
MAQGLIKKPKSTTASSSKKSSSLAPKRGGPRVIAPKKASLIKQRKMAKKLSAGLIAKTEETLAQRAGHLEMLANARKEKQKEKTRHGQQQKKNGGA